MRRIRYKHLMVLLAACVAAGGMWFPGEPPPKGESASKPAVARGGRSRTSRLTPREEAFKAALAHSVLAGSWQMTKLGDAAVAGEAARPAGLSEPREDKYTIDDVSKSAGDNWVISARVQYADKDVTIPVPVQVKWAGDTPVITLDKSPLPGLGTYSARVVIDNGFYAGTWSGTNYGGVMSGRIIKQDEADSAGAKPATTAPVSGSAHP